MTRCLEVRDLTAMEQRHEAARTAYLRDNPKPRYGGDWAGAEGWSALMDAQHEERKRLLPTNTRKVN